MTFRVWWFSAMLALTLLVCRSLTSGDPWHWIGVLFGVASLGYSWNAERAIANTGAALYEIRRLHNEIRTLREGGPYR